MIVSLLTHICVTLLQWFKPFLKLAKYMADIILCSRKIINFKNCFTYFSKAFILHVHHRNFVRWSLGSKQTRFCQWNERALSPSFTFSDWMSSLEMTFIISRYLAASEGKWHTVLSCSLMCGNAWHASGHGFKGHPIEAPLGFRL